MDKKITTEQIIGVLKKAGKIKDRIIPLCEPVPRYQGRVKGYTLCPKCYPNKLVEFTIGDQMSITKRMDKLEKRVDELTEMMIKTDKVLKAVLRQTDRLLKELENSKLFEKTNHES